MKSDISSTQGTRSVVPALRGQQAFGFAGRVPVSVWSVVVVNVIAAGLSDCVCGRGARRSGGAITL